MKYCNLSLSADLRCIVKISIIFLCGLFYCCSLYSQNIAWRKLGEPNTKEFTKLVFAKKGCLIAINPVGGVYRSTDDGKSWEQNNRWISFGKIYLLKSDNKGNVYLASSDGLFFSNDNGESWDKLDLDYPFNRISDITISKNGKIILASDNKIFISDESLTKWIDKFDLIAKETEVFKTCICIKDDETLFISTPNMKYYLYDLNSGQKSEIVLNNINDQIISLHIYDKERILFSSKKNLYIYSLKTNNLLKLNFNINVNNINSVVINSQSEIFVACDKGILKSINQGTSWTILQGKSILGEINSIVINEKGLVHAATSNGIFRIQESSGNSEGLTNTLENIFVKSIAINQNDDIYIGTILEGVFYSDAKGLNWNRVDPISGLTDGNIQVIDFSPWNYIYVGTYEKGLFFSSDGGRSWKIENSIDNRIRSIYSISSFGNKKDIISSSLKDKIWVGTHNGLFYSNNIGNTWSRYSASKGDDEFLDINTIILKNNRVLYGGFYPTLQNSSNFKKDSNRILIPDINLLCIAENANGTLFLGTSSNGLLYSKKANYYPVWEVVWEKAKIGVDPLRVNSIAIDKNNYIFIGTQLGVYRSTNEGLTWSEYSNGLANKDILSLKFNSKWTLFAGTNGDGVYLLEQEAKIKLSESSISFLGYQNNDEKPESKRIYFSFEGEGTSEWEAETKENWITIKSSNTIENYVDIIINKTNLKPGTYKGKVIIKRKISGNKFKTEEIVVTYKVEKPLVTLSGILLDGNGNPLEAEIVIEDLGTGEELSKAKSSPDGKFNIKIPSGREVAMLVNKEKYFPSADASFDLRNITTSTNIVVRGNPLYAISQMINERISVTLNNIFFEVGKADLNIKSRTQLKRVAKVVREQSNHRVEISGHTDNTGSDQINLNLSDRRAGTVVKYLVEKENCDKRNLESKGYGKTKPKVPNDTEANKALNRRVEFKFLN